MTMKQSTTKIGQDPSMDEESADDSDFIVPEESNSTLAETHCSDSDKDKEIHDRIVKVEEKAVRRARLVVSLAVAICAIAVSASVFRIASRSDEKSFELDFESYSEEIVSLVQWEVQYNFALMQQLSATITTTASTTGTTFPFVTVPDYEVSAGYTDGMGGIMLAGFAPLVQPAERIEWEKYSVDHQGWLAESARLKVAHPSHRDPLHGTIQDHEHDRRLQSNSSSDSEISPHIYRWENDDRVVDMDVQEEIMAPLWQLTPADPSPINVNLLSDEIVATLYSAMIQTNQSVLSPAITIGNLFDFAFDTYEKNRKQNPHALLLEPVYAEFGKNAEIVGFAIGLTSFENLLNQILPEGKNGIVCVFTDTCGNAITFEVNGAWTKFLGFEDHHETSFDAYERSEKIEMYKPTVPELCVHTLHIYPSSKFRKAYNTNGPIYYTALVFTAFLFTGLFLAVYDLVFTRRQRKTMKNYIKTDKLISSLFPETVRDRLLQDNDKINGNVQQDIFTTSSAAFFGNDNGNSASAQPIADFFPEATIMFADIAGFTAWSSTREPRQVFTLLETIYGAFDIIAMHRHVFKVETVGDCYVAVCGLPIPNKAHAVTMVRFAHDCLTKMAELSHKLEVQLGPDTAELNFRIGLHSGPVTGGVLRGKNARFQLFGDTMNTTARMESTGLKGRIQISEATASLLREAGKGHWLTPREDTVNAKGKGELQTYWAWKHGRQSSRTSESTHTSTQSEVPPRSDGDVSKENKSERAEFMATDKMTRLVDWNVEILSRLLRQVVLHRRLSKPDNSVQPFDETSLADPQNRPIEEFQEAIDFPTPALCNSQSPGNDPEGSELDPVVVQQLHDYVSNVAATYNNENPFHNFEHAAHVTMSVSKLLARIANAPTGTQGADCNVDYTYGITADPMTQFACVLSAIIHDANHPGIPNAQLIQEDPILAEYYQGKSIAEQNSIDLAWRILMENDDHGGRYRALRQAIYTTPEELMRFRQLLVNSVLATDIADKDLKADRNARWNKVFCPLGSRDHEDEQVNRNRKATIVIEHLIQASDIAHTMQHWHIYRKWNERFFMECHRAYVQGKAKQNPAEYWYAGEIGFFDFYIIPLAKKLKECGVFGVSSDEYLNYAMRNRMEWEERGQLIVAEMVAMVERSEKRKRKNSMQS